MRRRPESGATRESNQWPPCMKRQHPNVRNTSNSIGKLPVEPDLLSTFETNRICPRSHHLKARGYCAHLESHVHHNPNPDNYPNPGGGLGSCSLCAAGSCRSAAILLAWSFGPTTDCHFWIMYPAINGCQSTTSTHCAFSYYAK